MTEPRSTVQQRRASAGPDSSASSVHRLPLLSLQEVAACLGVSDRTVWQLVNARKLRSVRIGRRRLVDPVDLDRFVEASKESRHR